MSFVHCRGCGTQLHDTAVTCPQCGAPQTIVAGTGSATLPDGVRGWSWGAFLFNWIWAVCNGTWIGLLCLIPVVGFVMALVLGVKGREWAWKNKHWDSLEQFNRVQRRWSAWGVGLVLAGFAIGLLGAFMPAYEQYRARSASAVAAQADTPVAPQPAPVVLPQPVAEAQPLPQPMPPNPEPAPPAPVPATETIALAPVSAPESGAGTVDPAANGPTVAADTRPVSGVSVCGTGFECVKEMLIAANPRRPDAMQAAALKLTSFAAAGLGDRKTARQLNAQGLSRYAAGDFDGAIGLFERAQQADAKDVEIKANLGMAFVRANRSQEAVEALVSALQIEPRRSSAWAPMAEALDQRQMGDAAYAALMLAYEFSSNKPKTVDYFRARAASETGSESMRRLYGRALQTAEAGY